MTNVRSNHIALAESLCSRIEIPVLAAAVLKAAYVMTVWSERARSRKVLRSLDRFQLDDIGVTPQQAHDEYVKPFWKP